MEKDKVIEEKTNQKLKKPGNKKRERLCFKTSYKSAYIYYFSFDCIICIVCGLDKSF